MNVTSEATHDDSSSGGISGFSFLQSGTQSDIPDSHESSEPVASSFSFLSESTPHETPSNEPVSSFSFISGGVVEQPPAVDLMNQFEVIHLQNLFSSFLFLNT